MSSPKGEPVVVDTIDLQERIVTVHGEKVPLDKLVEAVPGSGHFLFLAGPTSEGKWITGEFLNVPMEEVN